MEENRLESVSPSPIIESTDPALSVITGKTVVLCLPGNDYSNEWMMYHFLPFLAELGNMNVTFRIAQQGGSNVCEVRETILGAQFGRPLTELTEPWGGKLDYDYMLWVDSDVLFKPEDFKRLVQWNKDIVCGLYLKNQQGDFAPARWDEEYVQGRAQNIWSLNVRDLVGKAGTCLEVLTISMGFALIKKGVFEKVPRPWFPCQPVQMPGGDWLFCGEDVCFSMAARKAGFQIWVDPEVLIPHRKASGWATKIPTQADIDAYNGDRELQTLVQNRASAPNRQQAFGKQ